jgi:hypothetical protein
MEKCRNIILALLLWLLVPIPILCVGIPFMLLLTYRYLITRVLRRWLRPDLAQPLVGLDAGFSMDSFYQNPKGGIAFVHIISGRLDSDLVEKRIQEVLNSKVTQIF